jgi:ATP/maltotriose-dependent transcriptional regulator MalT/DNA-binding SARP family transcriptional activator
MKKIQPTFAKLTVPSLPRIVERRRLFRRLDQARKRPIVWITGPPGAGKTTLVASYLRARKLRSLWYQVDEGDADPATFFHYLGLAGRKAAPRIRRPLPHLTPEYLLGLEVFTRRVFEDLFARLRAPVAVVFDNYQTVPSQAPFHDVLAQGLSGVPAGISVIVLSRANPPPALARLQAEQRMAQIEEDALWLTKEEATRLVTLQARTNRKPVPRQVRAQLVRQSQGWVAGLVLLLEQRKTSRARAHASEPNAPEVLFDYLAREVLKQLDPETQGFLLKTAFCPSMTAKMAEKLTGLPGAGSLLEQLYRSRHFTERRPGKEPLYQYHPLFREFLVASARQTLAPSPLSAVLGATASLLEQAGQINEAVALRLETKQHDEVARIVLAQAPALLAQGRARVVEDWIRRLPGEQIERNPWLLFWLASCRLPVDPKESRVLFERALQRFTATQDRSGALLAWCGAIESMAYAWDEAIDVDERLAEFDRLMQGGSEYPSAEIEARVASAMLNMLIWQRPQSPLIRVWIERILPRLTHLPDLNLTMQIAFPLLLYRMWMGEGVQARPLLAMLRHRLRSEEAPPLARLVLSFSDSVYDWTLGEPEQSLDAATKGLALAEASGVTILTPWLMGQRVFAKLVTWDLDGAQALLDKLQPQLEHRQDIFGGFYHHVAGKVCALRGALPESFRHAERSAILDRRCGALYPEALSRLDMAKILYDLGEDRAADGHLTWALEFARDANTKLIEFIGLVIRADRALKTGDETAGLVALRAALAIGAETEFFYPMLPGRSAWPLLCATALEAGIEPAYVKRLIRIMRLVPQGPARYCEAWPWPVKITTLGSFALAIDERPLRFSGKAPHRQLDLLFAIVALGGQDIPVTRLIDALWPNAEGDTGHETFEKTLQRLRRLLDHDHAIQVNTGKLSLNPQVCWVDAWALEQVAARVETESEAGTPNLWRQLGEQAMSLYRGPFLPDKVEIPWTEPFRDRLRRRFVRLVERLADRWLHAGHPQKAIDVLEHAIEADPVAEPLSLRLMNELAALERRTEAIGVYHRCRKALADHLGAPPSADLERAYGALRARTQG